MGILQQIPVRSEVLRDHVSKYAWLGLSLSFLSILLATTLVSYQLTSSIDFSGLILAQKTNPALWALDFTPFMFLYWGQSFCYGMANTMETLIDDETRELKHKSTELELKLHYEKNHDSLTNIPNQRLFLHRLHEAIHQVDSEEQVVVLVVHVNGFKEWNTTLGSVFGNQILVRFAERLKLLLLEPYLVQEHMGMNMIARLQGAEFGLLLPRIRKDHHWDDVLSKLLAFTAYKLKIEGKTLAITTSVGIAIYPLHGGTDRTVLKNAESSLYDAEKAGLTYKIYSP